jgi:hypothetical protein
MEQFTRDINGTTYVVTPFMADEALDLGLRITKLLLPTIGSGIGSVDLTSAVLDSEISVGRIFEMLANRLDLKEVKEIIAKLFERVGARTDVGEKAMNQPAGANQWRLHFVGKTGEMLRVLGFALEAQLTDFFVGLREEVARGFMAMRSKKATTSPSLSPSPTA